MVEKNLKFYSLSILATIAELNSLVFLRVSLYRSIWLFMHASHFVPQSAANPNKMIELPRESSRIHGYTFHCDKCIPPMVANGKVSVTTCDCPTGQEPEEL
jgi:hypothetical protein